MYEPIFNGLTAADILALCMILVIGLCALKLVDRDISDEGEDDND